MDQRFVAAATFAALVTLVTILTLRRLAPRFGLVDKPDERKRHRGRVPVVGGVSFFLGTVVGLAYFSRLDSFSVCLLAAGSLIFLTGLIDDIQGLSVGARLLVQAGATSMVIAASGIYIDGLGHLVDGGLRLYGLGIPVTIIAVVGLINAFNMLDGIDGLAASMALVSIFFVLIFASADWPMLGAALILQILAMALIPYLFANLGWPDGHKIFMGDAGSTFIGFVLAWVLIYMSHRAVGRITPADVLWCVAIPVMDTVAVTSRRIRMHRSPFACDRRHLHHRLLDAGFTSRETLILIVSAGILMGMAGYALRRVPEILSLGTFFLLGAGYVWWQPNLLKQLRQHRAASTPTSAAALQRAMNPGEITKAAASLPTVAGVMMPEGPANSSRWPELPVSSTAADMIPITNPAAQGCSGSPARMIRALCVFGASSEDIRLAPIMQQLSKDPRFECRVCVAAHDDATARMLRLFGIRADLALHIEDPMHDSRETISVALTQMKQMLGDFKPDVVLIHGDTPAALAMAMAARYEAVPVAHMDGRLSFENQGPWPDENHRLISTLTSLHFAPTKLAGRILVSAGIPEERVTVVDSAECATLRSTVDVIRRDEDVRRGLAKRFPCLRAGSPLVLAVGQPRGENYSVIVRRALRTLAGQRPDLDIVCPAGGFTPYGEWAHHHERAADNIHHVEPLDYLAFAYLLSAAHIVLTSSAEVRAEAGVLGKPAILVRDSPSRASDAGGAHWIAGSENEIVECLLTLLVDKDAYGALSRTADESGNDEQAYLRIIEALANVPRSGALIAA